MIRSWASAASGPAWLASSWSPGLSGGAASSSQDPRTRSLPGQCSPWGRKLFKSGFHECSSSLFEDILFRSMLVSPTAIPWQNEQVVTWQDLGAKSPKTDNHTIYMYCTFYDEFQPGLSALQGMWVGSSRNGRRGSRPSDPDKHHCIGKVRSIQKCPNNFNLFTPAYESESEIVSGRQSRYALCSLYPPPPMDTE